MLDVKPVRTNDGGKMVDDYWSSSKKVVSDIKFLDRLKQYDKDNINPVIIRKIREKQVSCRIIGQLTIALQF